MLAPQQSGKCRRGVGHLLENDHDNTLANDPTST
jgi:hypothetical protein